MIDFLKKNKVQIGLLFTLIVCLFIPYLLNYRVFLFNADQQLQYNLFYKEWMKLVKDIYHTGSLPFYSFNTFLGSNFYASKLYYLTGDIFFPIMVILSKFITDIDFSLELFSVFYVFLSSISFYVLLYLFGIRNKWYMFIGALIYALSGMASNYVGQYMFHRFYSLLPFLFASIEYYRKTGQIYLFSIIVFILVLTSYYFMFPTTLFLVAYSFFTIFYHSTKRITFKSIFRFGLPLIGAYCVGILLSAFLTVPGFLFIKDNSRLGVDYIDKFFEFRLYLGYLHSFITAPLTLFSKYDYLFNVGFNGHLTWYSIYAGSAIVPFIFSTIFIRNNRRISSLRYLIILLNVFALIPYLSSIMHGFSEPSFRWVFLIPFVHILGFVIVLEHYDEYRKEVFNGSILFLLIFIFTALYGYFYKGITIYENPIHLRIIVISLILYCAYLCLIGLKKLNILLIVLIFEIIFTFSTRLWILSETYYSYTPSLDEDAIAYFRDVDDDLFYRIYVNPDGLLPTSSLNLNQSINFNYFSTTTYDSTYEYNLKQFLELNNINWHIIRIDHPDVLRMLGVKYYYVTDISELPNQYSWVYRYNINHYQVYEMNESRSIGFTYSKFIRETSDISQFNWNDTLIVPDDLYKKLSNVTQSESRELNIYEFSNNRLVGNIELDSDQVLFLSIPYSTGWNVYVDNQWVNTYEVQGGFIGFELNKGNHTISLQFVPPGFKIGILTSLFGLFILSLVIINDFKKKIELKPDL